MITFFITAIVGSMITSVTAHGYVQGVVVDGTFFEGYSPSFQYKSSPPVVIGWSVPEDINTGFIDPSNYTGSNIICHLDATPAGTSAKIAAGDIVELQWTDWPESHKGPVLDYLAKCPGDCSTVDKTKLEFFKIDEGGLIDGSSTPGTWASDQLIAKNNSWAVTIPRNIAPGNYILRHEIIALHSAGHVNGAQNYPQCINLEVTSDGNDMPFGTLGTKLYHENDPGVLINIYTSLETYKIPGPSLYGEACHMSPTEVAIHSAAAAVTGSSTSYLATAIATTSTGIESKVEANASPDLTPKLFSHTSTTTTPYTTINAVAISKTATDTSDSFTTTIYETITDFETTTITGSSAAATQDSATPTICTDRPSRASSSPEKEYVWGDKPPKPLPDGYTLTDLLAWVSYSIKQIMENKAGHQRDFKTGQEDHEVRPPSKQL